ncbi:MAG: hypothetical protein AAFW87_06765 [Pseudomonadota bacterium]
MSAPSTTPLTIINVAAMLLCFAVSAAQAQTYECSFSRDCFQTDACTSTREGGQLEKTSDAWQWTPKAGRTTRLEPLDEQTETSDHMAWIAAQSGEWVLLISLFKDGSLRLTSNFWYEDEARTITLHGKCDGL